MPSPTIYHANREQIKTFTTAIGGGLAAEGRHVPLEVGGRAAGRRLLLLLLLLLLLAVVVTRRSAGAHWRRHV